MSNYDEAMEQISRVLRKYLKYSGCKNDEFPYNLTFDIFQNAEEAQNIYLPGISDILSTLTPREQNIIHKRYYEKLTLEECGKDYGIGKERVRQIQAKALRKLRHPSRKNMIIAVPVSKLLEAQKNLEVLKHEHTLTKEAIEEYKNKIGIENEPGMFYPLPEKAITLETPITELALSFRAQNSLSKKGIKDLKGIVAMTEDEISKTRSIGDKTAKEIKDYIARFGLRLREEEIHQKDIGTLPFPTDDEERREANE